MSTHLHVSEHGSVVHIIRTSGVNLTLPHRTITVHPRPVTSVVNLDLFLVEEHHPVRRTVHIRNKRNLIPVRNKGKTLETTGELLSVSSSALLHQKVEITTTDTETSKDNGGDTA